MNISKLVSDFIVCHEGFANKILHIIGLVSIAFGLVFLNIYLYLFGGLIQEFGHFYQYLTTKEKKYSPIYCLKPQLLFIYPLFIAGAIYIVFYK